MNQDSWLSDQIGKSAFILEPEEVPAFTPSSTSGFVSTKISPGDIKSIMAAHAKGFYLVDTQLILSQEVSHWDSTYNLPLTLLGAQGAEEECIAQIANSAFKVSRFHMDPGFELNTAKKIKENWVRNYFRKKRGDALWVAKSNDQILGFTLLIKTSEAWVIDLIATHPEHTKKGIGRFMISQLNHKYGLLKVGTQIANLESLALYQKTGFRIVQAKYVFHFHW